MLVIFSFPTTLSKVFFLKVVKIQDCMVKIKLNIVYIFHQSQITDKIFFISTKKVVKSVHPAKLKY